PARRDLAVDLDDAYFQDGFARIAARSGGDDAQVLEAGQLGSAVQRLAAYADRDSAGVWVAGVRAGEARTLRFPAQGLRVQIPRDAVTADAVVYVRGADSFGRSLEGMTRLTRPVRLGPVGWVLHAPLEVHLDMEHPGRGEAVYRYDDYRRSWSYLASDMDSAGWTAKSDRPGVFAVFRDTAAPRLGRPSLAHVRSWATGAVWREIHIPIDDAGSGFDEARTRVRVGGARHIFRWDFVGKKLIVPLRDDSIIGQQSVRVVAFDRSGNRSTRDAVVDTGSR
ncbi:MAG TPA: hypothetical protein VFH88_02585, partial [Candidatus Krumholzibacteria bacterium]|nr:hypothetical protein [Candidatus Krumholzibacteria bacterium]